MTFRHRQLASFALALSSALLVACSQGDAPESQPGSDSIAAAPPTTAAQADGAELVSADYIGLEDGNIEFHLHWVGGPVAKDPPPGAEPPVLQAVKTVAGSSFDRVMFRFEGAALPGYELTWAAEPPESCARQSAPPAGGKHLRLRLRSVNSTGSVTPELADGLGNLQGVAQTCAESRQLDWHLGVTDSAQVRVIELRAPPRLVVDVRHGGARVPVP